MGEENRKNTLFITISIVVSLIVLRSISEMTEYVVPIVAFINTLMLGYVFYTIDANINAHLSNRKCQNPIFKRQYCEYHKFRKKFIIWGLIVALVYIVVLCMIKELNVVGGCINDCIAFVTFGLSLEDDTIYSKLKKYYTNTDFSIKKG